MKASGKLLYGVQIGDVIHYDYTVALPVMKHTVKALASTMDALGEMDTPAAYVHYRVALLAEVLESLGSMSKEDITADFLLENLIEDDLDILDAELAGLKKKRMPVPQNLPGSEEPPSSSDALASAQNVSKE